MTKAAQVLGVTRQTLNDLIHGRRGVSPEMAIRLDMAFGGGAETWVRVQAAYDLAQARKRADFAIKRVSGAEVLIIVCKIWFDELRSGAKRVEYSYGRTFNERVFYIGRWSPSPTGATGCRPG